MKITVETSTDGLNLINKLLHLSSGINFSACNTQQKTMLSLVYRIKSKLMLKAFNSNELKSKMKLKLEYYEASALHYYLVNFSDFFELDVYQKNKIHLIQTQLHQKLC